MIPYPVEISYGTEYKSPYPECCADGTYQCGSKYGGDDKIMLKFEI
jgi:hypothetical protein